MSAQICPVCKGTGRYIVPPPGTGTFVDTICHGCGGKGWVEVQDSVPAYSFPYSHPFFTRYSPYTITWSY